MSVTAADKSAPKPLAWWGRAVLSVVAGFAIIFIYSAIPIKQVTAKTAEASPALIALMASAEDEGLRIADIYNIPAPKIEFLESAAPGLTKPPIRSGEASTIELGSAIQRGRFIENPALLRAVVAHEMGHAVQNARGTGYPTLLVLLMYVCSLAPVLLAFPSGRGIFLWACFLLALLILLSNFAGMHAHVALRTLLIGQALASLVLWLLRIHPLDSLPTRISRFVGIRPSAGIFAVASILGVLLFFLLGIYLGSKNVERELFADQVAVCEVGVEPIKEALQELRGNSKNDAFEIFSQLFDPFHPLLAERLAAIEAMQHSGRLLADCDAIRKGIN
jgi:Zn-dependent protease with chaperone function